MKVNEGKRHRDKVKEAVDMSTNTLHMQIRFIIGFRSKA